MEKRIYAERASMFVALLEGKGAESDFGQLCRIIAVDEEGFDAFLMEETGMWGSEITAMYKSGTKV